MLAASFLLSACGVLLAPQNQEELVTALAAAIDLPTATERAEAVPGLLQRSGDVATWLSVCATFGDFAALTPGPMKVTRELSVLGRVEETELHLFVPQAYDPKQPAPLLVWLHGSGGSGAGQHRLWQQVAEQIGMLVLAPTEAVEGVYNKSPRERAAVFAAMRWARRVANVDENAVFVGGWSRGGHLTWDLALRHPDHFAGMLPCVGGPLIQLGDANNMRYLENVAHLPIRDLQGSQDDPRLLMNLRLAFQQLKKLRASDAKFVEFPELGHDARLDAVDWTAFFKARREPWPRRVVRCAAEREETRSAWLDVVAMEKKVRVDARPRVNATHWARLDEARKRAYILEALAKSTARWQVTRQGKGRYKAVGSGVTRFSLLLAEDHVPRNGKIDIRYGRHKASKVVQPSAEVLLREFVERFDRTRLPVARVDVP